MATSLAIARFAGQNDPGLYLVHPQDPDQERRCTCDIFIVHGLHGGATKSWQHPESGVIWFQHLLPEYIRNQTNTDMARIWTFGYPADITFQTATIYELALTLLDRVKGVRKGQENRKILWVCHSLGGIVVKHALVEAQLTARYQSIRATTAGIVFLSTPHQGSRAANIGNVVASVVKAATPGYRLFAQDNLRDLKRDSPALFEISSKFSNICAGISIHTFYETAGGHQIVDRNSAVLNVTNEVKRFGLRVTHQEMGKFRDVYDQNWQPVAQSIVELVQLTATSFRPPLVPANVGRPSGRPWYSDPEPSTSYQPTPPQQDQSSYLPSGTWAPGGGQPQAQSGSWRTPSPTYELPREASVPQRDQRVTRPTSESSSYPGLNQRHSRLTLRDTSNPTPASRSAHSSPAIGSTQPRSRSPAAPPQDPGEVIAECDGCGRSIGTAEHQAQCTVCYDYDLCAGCFQTGKISKGHSASHKVSHVLNTLVLLPDDLVAARDAVNPAANPYRAGRANWTLVDLPPNTPGNPKDHTVTLRHLHLFENDSHARFRAYARPGHYGVAVDIAVECDPDLEKNPTQCQQMMRREGGMGKLRVTLGVVQNNEQFAGTRFAEDSFTDTALKPGCLPSKLFSPGFVGSMVQLDVGDAQYKLQPNSLLHVRGAEDSLLGIGLLLQWSNVPSYQRSVDPLVTLTVLNVRLYNVLDYSEPYVRCSAPVQTRPVPIPQPGTADDDDDDDPTPEEFLAAFLEIQRAAASAQEKARREEIVRAQLEQQERAKREAFARLYLQAIAETMEEVAAEQEKQRQQAALEKFFRDLGLR